MSPTWELVRKADPGSAESILTLTSPPGDSHAPNPNPLCVPFSSGPQGNFFVKGQIANILGFAGHRVSITTIPNSATVEQKWPQTVHSVQFSSVQSFSRVPLFVTPRTAAHQASLSITNSRSPPKPMSIESVMPSDHLILCHPLLLLPSIFPSFRVFFFK